MKDIGTAKLAKILSAAHKASNAAKKVDTLPDGAFRRTISRDAEIHAGRALLRVLDGVPARLEALERILPGLEMTQSRRFPRELVMRPDEGDGIRAQMAGYTQAIGDVREILTGKGVITAALGSMPARMAALETAGTAEDRQHDRQETSVRINLLEGQIERLAVVAQVAADLWDGGMTGQEDEPLVSALRDALEALDELADAQGAAEHAREVVDGG